MAKPECLTGGNFLMRWSKCVKTFTYMTLVFALGRTFGPESTTSMVTWQPIDRKIRKSSSHLSSHTTPFCFKLKQNHLSYVCDNEVVPSCRILSQKQFALMNIWILVAILDPGRNGSWNHQLGTWQLTGTWLGTWYQMQPLNDTKLGMDCSGGKYMFLQFGEMAMF